MRAAGPARAACQRAFLRSARRKGYFGDAHRRLRIRPVAHGRGWVAAGDLAADEVVLIEKALCSDDEASLAAAFARSDCDGVADEDHVDAFVDLGTFSIYAFEASRPGATSGSPGTSREPDDARAGLIESRACSRPNVLPWANVDWQTAADACAAAGARLCTPSEWMRACGGPRGEAFPYGGRYIADRCNGGENDADPGRRGVQDEVLPTNEMQDCVRRGVHDLSGNVKEWVSEPELDLGTVRGGGYATNLPGGLACGQVSDLKPLEFRHDSIGFRCCR